MALISCNQKANKNNSSAQESETQMKADQGNEAFQTLETNEINSMLATKTENLTPKDVMELYYPAKAETGEGNEKIDIMEKNLDNGNVLVTLIHDNMMDDSVKGKKYVMELKKNNSNWKVLSIKYNWICWKDRGNTDWGTKLCN